MGCGTSINEEAVKEPKQSYTSEPEIKELGDSNGRFLSDRKLPELKETKTEKSIMHESEAPALKEEEAVEIQSAPGAKILLFGESATERKIIEFSALPTPTIEILLSRNNNPTPIKYQPNDVILEESQELCSSFMYSSTCHPPYNYMVATYIKNSVIFLCGGVNYDFNNVSNEAFLYTIKDELPVIATPSKGTTKKERRIGNNLMGSKFERLPLMKNKRYSHMGVFLKTGKLGYVYVMGGRTENDQALKCCEKYSIQENKWTQIADLNYPRSTGFSMIINQKIYVFGGFTCDSKRSKKIERYNPIYDKWEILNIQLHKGVQTGLILPCPQKNDILLVGGNVEYGSLKSVIRLNFENETYCWDSDMRKERLLQKGISLLEQNVAYVFGGDFQDTIQKYSYKDKTWKNMNNLNYSSCVSPDEVNAFTMAQPTIALEFGTDSNDKKEKEQEFCESSRFIFGSDDYPCIYELNTQKWVLKKRNVPMSLRMRSFMTATQIKPGKIFVAGGIDSYFQKASRAAYIYYPGTNKAIQISKMSEKKYDFAACSNGSFVYIFGGRKVKDGEALINCEKYDVNEDKWIALPDMPRERVQAKAILTPNLKKILLIGGNSYLQSINEIDIFDIETESFTTFQKILPLPLEIRSIFIEKSNKKIGSPKKLKTEEQFEFLDDQNPSVAFETKKETSMGQNNENMIKNEGIQAKQWVPSQGKGKEQGKQQIDQENYDLLIFNYNSYLKHYNSVSLTVQVEPHEQIMDNSLTMKLNPYSLAFEQKLQGEEKRYYFISGKGVFKWERGKQMVSQIVINQIHILQLPLERFTMV